MMQYLVILLDDTSVSYCHCDNPHKERRLIGLDDLRMSIRYAMMENLMVQMVYPNYALPQEYLDVIDTIDHHDIVPWGTGDRPVQEPDVVVMDGLSGESPVLRNVPYVLRITKAGLFKSVDAVAQLTQQVARLNVVITDVETITDAELPKYREVLDTLAEVVKAEYLTGCAPQLNLLTDRMMLDKPNHCNAGVENITLAPNGRFYLCPAFYYTDADDNVGSVAEGLDIRNPQLLRLDHAPLCRHCDVWHCRRCVWLNRKMTYEVNTPSHEQCVMAHTERETTRRLLANVREKATFMSEVEIKEIDYSDPFDVRKEW
ncbi:MAG: CXXX repeat peptide maturase [Bacteroidales bacterium]|nr:CXXX repeat peptide maturase [Bacteroidales bacterium]